MFDNNNIWEEFNEAVLFEDNNDTGDDDLDLDDGVDTQSDDSGSEDNSSDDNSENNSSKEDNTDDQNNEDNTTDDNTDQVDDDASDDSGEDDEESLLDDNGNDTGDGEGGADDTTDSGDQEMDPGIEDDSTNDPNAKLKELEKSIFDQLSTEQKALKTKELKTLFNSVYDKCTEIINTISSADRNPEQAKIYDYVMNSLTDLQKYIKDYLFQIYDSKTYIENMVQLQKYLTVLDTVSNIFEEVRNSSEQENKGN